MIYSDWKLQLPISNGDDNIKEVSGDKLETYESEFFRHVAGGFVLTTPCSGVTTLGSHYPRTELREMHNGVMASWNILIGLHVLDAVIKLIHKPEKISVIFAQIKATGPFQILKLIFKNNTIFASYEMLNGKKRDVPLNLPHFDIYNQFHLKIEVFYGTINVFIDGANVLKFKSKRNNVYFKIGNYIQINDPTLKDIPGSELYVGCIHLNHKD